MKFVSEAESAALVTHEMAFNAAREALVAACGNDATSFPVVLGHGSSKSDRFTVKAASNADIAGLKVGSYWPGNPDRRLPRHNSLILLFDQDIGKIAIAIEAGIVNAYRTAAANAVATDLLARPDAETLAIFGAGNQARYECAALARIRPICQVLVVARDSEQANDFVSDLRDQGLDASTALAQAACESADIIVTATASRAPLFEASWVRSGTHVSSMGSDATGKQELPSALFGRAKLFCDLPAQSRSIGEFQHLTEDQPLIALGDVLAGRCPGREAMDEITIFDSSGLSLQDLYIARHILAKLEED